MRRLHLPVAAALAAGVLPLLGAAPAAAAVPAGTYVPLAVQSRVVDTRTGAAGNHKGAVHGGHGITVTIAGRGGVPASGVGAVVATITALQPTANGGIVGYVGARPNTTDLQFAKGRPASNTAVLPLASGKVTLFNSATTGTVQLVVDVSGYYTSGAPSPTDPGVFRLVKPARLVNTITGGAFGNRRGALGAGSSVKVSLAHAGVPASAGAVAVMITALNAHRPGTVTAHRPDEPAQNLPLVNFVPGRATSGFAVLRVSDGIAALHNASAGRVDLFVDVLGYYNIGFATTAHAFQTLVPTAVPRLTIPAGSNHNVSTSGQGGVPLSGVAAVLVTLRVLSPAKPGAIQAWRADKARPRTTSVLTFAAGQTVTEVAFVPVAGGTFALHNLSRAKVTIAVTIDGFVPGVALTVPAVQDTARYFRRLVDSPTGNATLMSDKGAADAHSTFVLLDIGAQLNDRYGVALTVVNTRISYANLVIALSEYLSAYQSAGGHGTIAIGTNNEGNFSTYNATGRGTDWANKVINQLTVPAGVTIAGANDIEATFASTEAQAEHWETAFLNATSKGLVFNGSADGCPKTWTPNATCAFGWTAKNLYALATGVGHPLRTSALPQTYFGYMATQWAEIDRSGGGRITFGGSLTEHGLAPNTLSAAQGWAALHRAVSSVTPTSIGTHVVDFG